MLSGLDPLRIEQHAHRLATELVTRVEPLGWTPFRPLTDPAASSHIVALSHPTMQADNVQRRLADEHNVICSSRNGSIRISLNVYNDDNDLAALVEGLRRLAPLT